MSTSDNTVRFSGHTIDKATKAKVRTIYNKIILLIFIIFII
jgi:hypothetical protein